MSELHRSRLFWVYLAVAAVLVGWIGIRTQITADHQERHANQAVVFADETRECLSQLLDALAARAKITEESDRLNNDQHKVITEMVAAGAAAASPEQYAAVLNQYLPAISKAQIRQESLLEARAAHPLPDPACPALPR